MLWPARGLESREAGEGQVTPVVLSSRGNRPFFSMSSYLPLGSTFCLSAANRT